MTIIAASIPVLRVLVREVRTSAARRYYGSNQTPGATGANGTHGGTHNGASGSRTFRGDKTMRSGTTATIVSSTGGGVMGRASRLGVGGKGSNADTGSDGTLAGAKGDDRSDKSILDVESGFGHHQSPTLNGGDRGAVGADGNRILRTDEVAVQYHDRKDTESMEYEMVKLR